MGKGDLPCAGDNNSLMPGAGRAGRFGSKAGSGLVNGGFWITGALAGFGVAVASGVNKRFQRTLAKRYGLRGIERRFLSALAISAPILALSGPVGLIGLGAVALMVAPALFQLRREQKDLLRGEKALLSDDLPRAGRECWGPQPLLDEQGAPLRISTADELGSAAQAVIAQSPGLAAVFQRQSELEQGLKARIASLRQEQAELMEREQALLANGENLEEQLIETVKQSSSVDPQLLRELEKQKAADIETAIISSANAPSAEETRVIDANLKSDHAEAIERYVNECNLLSEETAKQQEAEGLAAYSQALEAGGVKAVSELAKKRCEQIEAKTNKTLKKIAGDSSLTDKSKQEQIFAASVNGDQALSREIYSPDGKNVFRVVSETLMRARRSQRVVAARAVFPDPALLGIETIENPRQRFESEQQKQKPKQKAGATPAEKSKAAAKKAVKASPPIKTKASKKTTPSKTASVVLPGEAVGSAFIQALAGGASRSEALAAEESPARVGEEPALFS